mgnify:CR=1 FL=1
MRSLISSPAEPDQKSTVTPGRFIALTRSRTSCRAATFEMFIFSTPMSRRSSSVMPVGNNSRKITRSDRPHDDPVDRAEPRLGAQLTRVPDHLGIDRWALDLIGLGFDPGQQVEIDETVIHRRDQRVGQGMSHLAEAGVAAGAVDDDEIAAPLKIADRRRQAQVIDVLIGAKRVWVDLGQFDQHWSGQGQVAGGDRVAPVLDIAPETALAQVEVQPADPVAHARQRRRHMHGRGRFARPALFVAENDDMRHRCPL